MQRTRRERIRIVVAIWLLVWGMAAMAFGQERRPAAPGYALEVWTTEHGLPQNSVRAITQTRDGYLWVGTFAGLARFDGVKFTTFDTSNTPALPSSMILALYEDRHGALWIGTDGKGLVKYAQGRFTLYAESAEAPVEWINRIWEDEAGNLLLMARHKPLQFKDGRFSKTTAYNNLSTETSQMLTVNRDGSLLAFVEGGIGRYQAGAWTNYKLPGYLGMSFGAEAGDGSFWLSTECCGLRRFGAGEPTVIGTTPNEMFYRDRQGELRHLQLAQLLGTANEAEARWALKLGLIFCGVEDREGNLWIGTNGAGLLCFKQTPVRAYSAAQGLSDDSFTAIVPDGTGGLWLAAKQVFHYQNGKFTALSQQIEPRAIHQDRAGGLWLGGYGRLKDGQLTKFPLFDGVTVVAFYEDRAGDIWLGTTSSNRANSPGGLYRYRDGVFTAYSTREGLADNDCARSPKTAPEHSGSGSGRRGA